MPRVPPQLQNVHAVNCFQAEEEAIAVLKDVNKIHKAAGIEMRNITYNFSMLLTAIRSPAVKSEDLLNINCETERILGMHWCKLKFRKV